MLTLVSASGRVRPLPLDALVEVLDSDDMPTEVAVARSLRDGERVRLDAEGRPWSVRRAPAGERPLGLC